MPTENAPGTAETPPAETRAEVPPKVAINEAIELAKNFGGETSGKFVNGVLGAVYKEIGEPGKDQKSKRQKKNEEVDITTLPVEQKAGALIYARSGDELYFALVHDIFGYWTLSKGGVEESEDVEAGAVREIKEELGLEKADVKKIFDSIYVSNESLEDIDYAMSEIMDLMQNKRAGARLVDF